MEKRPNNFWSFLGATFTSTQGIIIECLGLLAAVILWRFTTNDTISMGKFLVIVIPCIVLVSTLFTAAYRRFSICKQSLPRVIKVRPFSPKSEDSSLLFLLEPSDLFPQGIQVSIFYDDDNIEQLLGLGTVIDIQQDGNIKVATTRVFEGYEDIIRDLVEKRTFDLKKIKVKPVVPQLAPIAVQRPVDIGIKAIMPLQEQVRSEKSRTQPEGKELEIEEEQEAETEIFLGEPKPGQNLFLEMIDAFFQRKIERAEVLFQEIQQKLDNPTEKLKNKAVYLFMRYQYGDSTALDELKKLTEVPDVCAEAHFWIGRCYDEAGDPGKATIEYEKAAILHQSDEQKSRMVVHSANSIYQTGRKQEAINRIIRQIESVSEIQAISNLFEGLASLFEITEQSDLRAVALEKAISLKPNNTALRFEAGFCFSSNGFHNLSLLHYKYLLKFDPESSGGYNNIGVEYNHLDMALKAVNSYKKSVALKNTLAASNLANKLLKIGFSEEALKLLNEAQQQENVHPNVATAIAAISQKEEIEARTEKSVLNIASDQQRFLLSFAEAYFYSNSSPDSFVGIWYSNDGTEITVSIYGNKIEGNWKHTFRYRFNGLLSNKAATIIMQMDKSTSGFEEIGHGYIYLSPDSQNIFLLALVKEWYNYEYKSWTLTKEITNAESS